jgi:hypothetical protein
MGEMIGKKIKGRYKSELALGISSRMKLEKDGRDEMALKDNYWSLRCW